jgi:hypothetical protein
MEDFLSQIQAALAARLYYVGLFAALGLPDICAALESPTGEASGTGYRAWFDEHVAPSYCVGTNRVPSFTGEDAYYFRCSFLHQARSQHPKSTYMRILFVEPGTPGLLMHNNVINDALNIDVEHFCRDVILGVHSWLGGVTGTEPFESNYQRMMKRYPDGLRPYITGVPVIS